MTFGAICTRPPMRPTQQRSVSVDTRTESERKMRTAYGTVIAPCSIDTLQPQTINTSKPLATPQHHQRHTPPKRRRLSSAASTPTASAAAAAAAPTQSVPPPRQDGAPCTLGDDLACKSASPEDAPADDEASGGTPSPRSSLLSSAEADYSTATAPATAFGAFALEPLGGLADPSFRIVRLARPVRSRDIFDDESGEDDGGGACSARHS